MSHPITIQRAGLVAALLTGALSLSAQSVVDFSDVSLTTPPTESYSGGGVYYNGSDLAGGFTSGGLDFTTSYNATYGSWSGWAYSTTTDTTTAGYGNQFSAFAGSGHGDSTYAIAYNGASLDLRGVTTSPLSVQITNTSYAGISVRDGDGFAKQFGGGDGSDPDYFLLTITGKDAADATTGTVDFYLADFRATDGAADYIVDTWTEVDLTGLGTSVASIEFSLSSSDNGNWGMNTPAYFAFDSFAFTAVPEPASVSLLLGLGTLGLLGLRRRR